MKRIAESRTRHFEEANADFRTCFVYFGLAFVHLTKAMCFIRRGGKHLLTGIALSFVLITAFSQKLEAAVPVVENDSSYPD